MDEIEVPLEKVQEDTQHHAAHGAERWLSAGAVLSAVLAVFAALCALMAGHHANEAMIDQLRASDHWSHYQAKSIKATVLETRHEILRALKQPTPEEGKAKVEQYRADQEELLEQAKEREAESSRHLRIHGVLATAVTLFQVAIAITAIAVLVRRRALLGLSVVFGLVGLIFLVRGLILPSL
jgi:hypothetical protein